MSSMSEAEQELYQAIYSMATADVRNELQQKNLPTTGTKTACCQRLYKFKRQFVLQAQRQSRTPVVSKITTRQGARNQAQANVKLNESRGARDDAILQDRGGWTAVT